MHCCKGKIVWIAGVSFSSGRKWFRAPVKRLLDGLLDVGLCQERRDIDGAVAQSTIRALWQSALPVELYGSARTVIKPPGKLPIH